MECFRRIVSLFAPLGDVSRYKPSGGWRLLRAEMALHTVRMHLLSRYFAPGYEHRGSENNRGSEVEFVSVRNGSGHRHVVPAEELFLDDGRMAWYQRRCCSFLAPPDAGLWHEKSIQRIDSLFNGYEQVWMNVVCFRHGAVDTDSWFLLHFDLDDIEVSADDLLCFPHPPPTSLWVNNDMRLFPRMAPRAISPVWGKLYERYREDRELLALLYHDSLWYHTGHHLHIVLRGRWNDPQRADVVESLRARLGADPRYHVHPLMKVRLAGNVHPSDGAVALGYFHPFAFPYVYPFAEDSAGMHYARVLDQYGILPADETVFRYSAPAPATEDELKDGGYPAYGRCSGPISIQSPYAKLRRMQVDVPLHLTETEAREWCFRLERGESVTSPKPTEQPELVTLWAWRLEFPAQPYGVGVYESLHRKGELYLYEDHAVISQLYTDRPPAWCMGKKKHYSRNFHAFRIELHRIETTRERSRHLTVVDCKTLEQALGTDEMVELEWAICKTLRSANRVADLLAFVWLNHLKRIRYQSGNVPAEAAVEYLTEKVGWSPRHARHRIRRLTRMGWLQPTRIGFVVHSWSYIAERVDVRCERVLYVAQGELRSPRHLRSLMASIPGTFAQPWIKHQIGQSLGVHKNTVKRNRKGRLRSWNRVRFVVVYDSFAQAETARRYTPHPVHGWPLALCGYAMLPQRYGKRWALVRSGAASVLDLVVITRVGKSKRLRRATSHLAERGFGVGSGVETFEPHSPRRYTNFSHPEHRYNTYKANNGATTAEMT